MFHFEITALALPFKKDIGYRKVHAPNKEKKDDI